VSSPKSARRESTAGSWEQYFAAPTATASSCDSSTRLSDLARHARLSPSACPISEVTRVPFKFRTVILPHAVHMGLKTLRRRRVPRSTVTADGLPGDPVNLALIGTLAAPGRTATRWSGHFGRPCRPLLARPYPWMPSLTPSVRDELRRVLDDEHADVCGHMWMPNAMAGKPLNKGQGGRPVDRSTSSARCSSSSSSSCTF
jgi:hypothetical protein